MLKRPAAAVLVAICCFSVPSARATIFPVASPDPNLLPLQLDNGAPGLTRALAQLRTRASFLFVTAHPDDEDGGMLAYETRQVGARGALMSLTRGEGGQNAVSPDLYDALGLLRTQELLEASRYYGTDLYWGSVIDYGFSKTREEALAKWGHERVLGEVVRIIRMTRPLVIASTWAGAPTDGHGNHQVAGEVAQEAFVAAGDPDRFPEQIKAGLRPWTPLKMYARVPFFQPTAKGIYDYATDKYVPVRFRNYIDGTWIEGKPSADVAIPEGAVQPASGWTSLQIGRTGLGFEKTQNGGFTTPPPVPLESEYHRYASKVKSPENAPDLYAGIDVSLSGIADLAGGEAGWLREGLLGIQDTLDRMAASPERVGPELATTLKQLRALEVKVQASKLSGKDDVLFELEQKDLQCQHALALALNVSVDAFTAPEKAPGGPFAAFAGPQVVFGSAIPGQSFAVQVGIFNPQNLVVHGVTLEGTDGNSWAIAREGDAPGRFRVKVPEDAAYTGPYFGRPDEEQPFYNLNEPRFEGLSSAPYPLVATARFAYGDVEFAVRKYVQAMQRVEGLGLRAYPLQVVPALSVQVSPAAGVVPLSAKTVSFAVTVRGNAKKPADGTLRLELPGGWSSEPAEYRFHTQREGDEQTVTFQVIPRNIKAEAYTIRAVATYEGKTYGQGYRSVGYPGIQSTNLYRPATYKAVGADVKIAPDLTVAYVPGTGDEVVRGLEDLGIRVTVLQPGDVEKVNLRQFNAVALGVRAYSIAGVRAIVPRLMEYVRDGGTVIAQYNTQDAEVELGPYPITLGGSPQKVVDETSAVQFLDRTNPVLQWPNAIGPEDFKGWQEERGHGFAQKWDPHYSALFEMHDPEQDAQSGGLLVARYGKGVFVYDALALYRQLPAGVPGAYRLFANLLSAGANPEWK